MFIDKVKIKISSGKGGNGSCTFLQEKFVAFGGPDGGDGGRGGSVYLQADNNMTTLLDFKYKSIFKADDGAKGSRKNMTGRSGEDLIIKVPVGTVVKDLKEEIIIADLSKQEQKILVAEGGRGGKGNAKFKTNKLRVPNFAEPGLPAIERELELELKMIADVGIIGFPNAGKSTLISKISAAKPKIADYAFTTIVPNLGVVRKRNGDGFVVADIPGLIEGAGEGKGLGHEFLRHIERTRLLVHLVDVWGFTASNAKDYDMKNFEKPMHNFIQVNYELNKFSEKLGKKKQIIVLNKIEAYPEDELDKLIKEFEEFTGLKANDQGFLSNPADPSNFIALFTISTITGEGYSQKKDGLTELQYFIGEALSLIDVEENIVDVVEDYVATDHDDSNYEIIKEQMSSGNFRWQISCGKLERLMKITDLKSLDSLQHLFHVVKSMGLMDNLKSKGVQEGDLINIDGVDFEITDAVL